MVILDLQVRSRNVRLRVNSERDYHFSLPWALHTLVLLPILQGWTVDVESSNICVFDGIFRLFLESWFALLPIVAIFSDPILSKDLPGSNYLAGVRDRIATMRRGDTPPALPENSEQGNVA